MQSPPDRDTIRICVATDNHLGFHIDDPILKHDPFTTFEEILTIAKKNDVDFLLLGGDLFHKNKPCRETEHRTFELFRKYCCGDRPVELKIHSRQKVNFQSNFGRVNYEDPNFNISLPVFAIHGNHDDPTGENALSALDMLSVTNLVNYFGKASSVDEVQVNPILISKGEAKLALYGLGYIRDERLYRAFQEKKVKFFRPKQDAEDWFNLFVIHQNRHREEHNKKNVISESMLRSFFDLVVWGHEHKCLINPQRSVSGQFDVIQPGSSVAVSLVPDEAEAKKICIVEISKKEYKHTPITLKTVRPFVYERINLAEEYGPVIEDKNDPEEIATVLIEKIESMIEEAQKKMPPPEVLERYPQLKLPLIRLRVDYSPDFATVHPQRFGQKFVDRVANPKDLILFSRKKAVTKKAGSGTNAANVDALNANGDPMEVDGGEVEGEDAAVSVARVLQTFMDQNDTNLSIMLDTDLADAIHDYVEKQENKSIEKLLTRHVKDMQKRLLEDTKDEKAVDEDTIMSHLKQYLNEGKADTDARREQRMAELLAGGSKTEEEEEEEDEEGAPAKSKRTTTKKAATKKTTTKKATTKTTTTRGKKAARSPAVSDDEFMESPKTKTTKGKKAATTKKATTKKATTKKATIKKAASKKDDEDFAFAPLSDEEVQAAPKPSPRASRKRKNVKEEPSDDDDDVVLQPPTKKRRITPAAKPTPSFISLDDLSSEEDEKQKKPARSSLSVSKWGKRKSTQG